MPAYFFASPSPRDDDVDDHWELPNADVNWDEIEAEARRQGCTVADILYDRAGRNPDA